MKAAMILIILNLGGNCYGQQDHRVTTIDFVQIVDNNKEEAVYYFQNNWKVLRDMAIEKKYILSYQLLETPNSESEPFQLMLITTYLNEEQYMMREEHFSELIKEKGPLKLMNEKQPADFRKKLFNKEMVRHLN
jgi:hypothetical protein